MVVNGTVVGPFEEEEEGTGIVSDVVKVEGEDPATPGLLPQGIDPGTVTIPQYRFNKTKQHTHNIFSHAITSDTSSVLSADRDRSRAF